jgi:uncharacterized integral membrane protein
VLRRVVFLLFAAVTLTVAAVFTWLNPGSTALDLAFAEVNAPTALAFVITLTLGWLLGWLSTAGYLWSLLREQRRLRAASRAAESELESLRSAPSAGSSAPPI